MKVSEDQYLSVLDANDPEFANLVQMRWPSSTGYQQNVVDRLNSLLPKASAEVKAFEKAEKQHNKALMDQHANELNTQVEVGSLFTGNVPYQLRDVYYILKAGAPLSDNNINAYLFSLKYYDQIKSDVDPSRRRSLFIPTTVFPKVFKDNMGEFMVIESTINTFNRTIQKAMPVHHGVKLKLVDVDKIFFPIHLEEAWHWSLLVGFVQERVVRIYDPLFHNKNVEDYLRKYSTIARGFLAAMTEYHRLDHNTDLFEEFGAQWRVFLMHGQPPQGANECGVYVSLYMDLLVDNLPVSPVVLPNRAPRSSTHGSTFRYKMAHDFFSTGPLSYCSHVSSRYYLSTFRAP
jgi:hypothetical protein